MWKFDPPGPQSPRETESLVDDLVGAGRGAEFWRDFRDRFITGHDIAQIATEGMNHVRLPINSRVVMAEDGTLLGCGFTLIDRLIEWCREFGLWVVLDLHGAPGGQTGTNIDDSPHGTPELFTDRRYQEMTVALWRELARRYRDETVVAGYDLLNEPLPNEYQDRYARELVALYREITAAIRGVDQHHLIIYEGTHWATDWSIFTEVWDANSMLQFHKYWSAPDRPSIQRFLDIGARLGLPVYMGEGGENNLEWLYTAFQLYDDCGISWNFWPWKKVQTRTSPCSVDAPDGWADVLAYSMGKADRPDADVAWRTLRDLLDRMVLARCTYRRDVVGALLRRPPLRIPATGFGFGGPGVSYHTSGAARPLAEFRADDRVTISRSPGAERSELSFDHTDGSPRPAGDRLLVALDAGDWVAYEVRLDAPSRLLVHIGLHTEADATPPTVDIDNAPMNVGPDGDTLVATSGPVGAGRHLIRVTGRAPHTLLAWLDVTPTT